MALKCLRGWITYLVRPGTITFRQLLVLVLPALLVGFLIRAALMIAVPEGYFGSDSNSYYEFSHRLLGDGVVDLNEKRRWLYPVFLALLDGLPGPAWSLVPFIQHLVGLLTVLGIGWCSALVVVRPRIVVPLVALLAAVWPRMLWYEHEFIAESLLLAAFVAVISLLLTPGIVRSRWGLIALMLAFTLLAGMKGAGRFLWLGSVLSLFLIHRDPRRWLWGKLSLLLAGLSVVLVSTIGKSSQGDWLALSSSLPLVRTEGEPYSRYRVALRAQILEARQAGDDYPWLVFTYKKRLNKKDPSVVHPDWAELNRNRPYMSVVARSFWTDAVLRHPVRFAGMTLKTMAIALSASLLDLRLDPSTFWDVQRDRVAQRWQDRPRYFNRLFGINQAEFEIRSQAGRRKTFVLLPTMRWIDQHWRWWGRRPVHGGGGSAGGYPSFVPQPLGLLAVLGSVGGVVLAKQRLKCLALLCPFLLYMSGTFAVGDAVPRYLQPVDWIGFVFVGVVFDLVLQVLSALHSYCRRLQQA